METYQNIIVNKLDKRVAKIARKKLEGSYEHYLLQKLVLHEKTESTKVSIAYDSSETDGESTYAKDTLGTKCSETELLGLVWNKHEDTLSISLPKQKVQMTKRTVLQRMAKLYDLLGVAALYLRIAKVTFRDICDRKIAWDAQLPKGIRKR